MFPPGPPVLRTCARKYLINNWRCEKGRVQNECRVRNYGLQKSLEIAAFHAGGNDVMHVVKTGWVRTPEKRNRRGVGMNKASAFYDATFSKWFKLGSMLLSGSFFLTKSERQWCKKSKKSERRGCVSKRVSVRGTSASENRNRPITKKQAAFWDRNKLQS